MADGTQTPAGWYADPENPGQQRYWDGTTWAAPGAPPPPAPPAPPHLSRADARAQAKAAKAYAKAQRPFYKKKRYWLLAIIIVAIIIGVAVNAGSKNTNSSSNNGVGTNSLNSSHPPQKDVTVTGCTFDSTINSLTAKLQIINHSSKTSNYIIAVVFNDAKGVQIGSTDGVDNNVAAGQTAVTTAVDIASQPPAGGAVACGIKNVDRLAS